MINEITEILKHMENAILNSSKYAFDNNIDPLRPETWDEKYKIRQQQLAGLLKNKTKELTEIIQNLKD